MSAGMPEKKSGQAMLESLIVILVTCLILFGLLQLAHGFATREVLRHAAARTARARTVGFNSWMCRKVMRVAAIPNAGRMLEPSYESFHDAGMDAFGSMKAGEAIDWSLNTLPQSDRALFENARIPEYLGSGYEEQARYILDYENWDAISSSGAGDGAGTPFTDDSLSVEVRQRYPLSIMIRSLYDWAGTAAETLAGDEITLRGRYDIENHYPLYLDDKGY